MKIIPVQYKAKGKGIKNNYKKAEVSWITVSKKDMSFYRDLNFSVLTKSSSNGLKGFYSFSNPYNSIRNALLGQTNGPPSLVFCFQQCQLETVFREST